MIANKNFKVVFGAVVLALSVTLAKQQVIGSPPPETSFFSFAGAFGLIASAIAILAIFIDKIPRVGVVAADALASVFYLAGAIVSLDEPNPFQMMYLANDDTLGVDFGAQTGV